MLMLKKAVAALLVALLMLPAAQQMTNFPRMKGLKGYFETPAKPAFSISGFWRGTYQDSLNTWLEHHIGFRPAFVRLHNQLRYSLFDTVVAQSVVRGKQGFLYELNYINALYGSDYVGDETVATHARQLAFINDWLSGQGKYVLVMLAPGKASFYPEYVPERYRPSIINPRNDFAYAQALQDVGVPVIHGNPWFSAMRDTSQFVLFPKSGIHWSYYGIALAFDSLFRKMESISGRKWLEFNIKNIEVTHQLRSPDRDLWEALNILLKPDDFPMPYPDLSFVKTSKPPRVMVVADSYYWQWFGSGYATESFGSHDFWYYNEQIYPGDGSPPIERRNVDLMLRVLETDFIILLLTDANMYRFGFGFVEQLYEAIRRQQNYDAQALEEIERIVAGIRSSEEWMNAVRQKAAERGISVEEMIRIDALWVLENNIKHQADDHQHLQ